MTTEAVVRPVLVSGKRLVPSASNHITSVRPDDGQPRQKQSFRSITPMGRFHAEIPRQFSSPKLDTTRPSSRPSLRVGIAPPPAGTGVADLLKTAAPLPQQQASAALLRQRLSSPSIRTSVDHPLSPQRRLDSTLQLLHLPPDMAGTTRTSSDASMKGSIKQTPSHHHRLWGPAAENETPGNRSGIRTYNSMLTPSSNRIIIPDAHGVQVAPIPLSAQRRSNSPTFRTSSQMSLAPTTTTTTEPPVPRHASGGLRTVIATFEPPRRELRCCTPRPYAGKRNESSIFVPPSQDRAQASSCLSMPPQRRAFTPEPPPRGQCALSLLDGPIPVSRPAKRFVVCPSGGSSSGRTDDSPVSMGARRHFEPRSPNPKDGIIGHAMGVVRQSWRNQSSIVFGWGASV